LINVTAVRRPVHRVAAIALLVPTLIALALGMRTAAAQTPIDPYTGEGVRVGAGVSEGPGLSIDRTTVHVNDKVRVSGCLFRPSLSVRFTLNPGQQRRPGTPCTGAPAAGNALRATELQLIGLRRGPLRHVELQSAPSNNCRFGSPTAAGPADTTAGGAIAGATTDNNGCLDVVITVPDRAPGTYELCSVALATESVCAVLEVVASTKVLGQDFARNGFARTGIIVGPLVVAAILAILVGRTLVRRGRRPAEG
jgi:hypothetical protein